MERIYLGFDTSNYRTSAAAVNERGEILFHRARLLDVKKGERGLRQSEAFFAHSNRLPEITADLFAGLDASSVAAIGASSRPRRVEGSYMPCFLAGMNVSEVLGSALGVPVYTFSHQEGHAAAVLGDENEKVIFMHLSGGTTEFLTCSPDDEGYDMQIIGGTLDISIGQLIDRTGVALGYAFPSGGYLDAVAYEMLEKAGFEIHRKELPGHMPVIRLSDDGYFNLSGAETKLLRCIDGGISDEDARLLITEMFISFADLLYGAARDLAERYSAGKVYMAGGVASSMTVRKLISLKADSRNIIFGDPDLSGDNAVGIALLARRSHETGKRFTGK